MEHEIRASFTWSERDYMAFTRALGMLRNRGYDSWVMRAGLLIFGHLFTFSGLFVAAMALSGAKGQNGPIPPGAVVFNLALSLVAAYVLFTKWYGLAWVTNRAFRSSQLPGLKVSYRFRPDQIEATSRLAQSKQVWSVISQIVEFRDGFILLYGNVAEWLPRHAFAEPFDDVRFLDLAKQSIKHHKFIDRSAYLNRKQGRGGESGFLADDMPDSA